MRADDDELSQHDYKTLAAFRYALRRFAAFSADKARDAGLTTHQHQALLALKAGGAMTVGRLADDLLIAPHSAAELVARLEAAQLVTKTNDSTDRRRVLLRLTPASEAALARLTLDHRREVRVLAPRLATLLAELERSREAE